MLKISPRFFIYFASYVHLLYAMFRFQTLTGLFAVILFLFSFQQTIAQELEHDLLVPIDVPAQIASGEPKLIKTDAGQVHLTWLQRNEKNVTLNTAKLEGTTWRAAQEITSGQDWFVNWADFPTMAVHDGGPRAASFLKKSGAGKYAYDVAITTAANHTANWGTPFHPHSDGTPTEHGFVTLLPWQANQFFALWLDGRNTNGHGHGGGAMTIRAAFFDEAGNIRGEKQLDERTCDCCQTTAVKTGSASLLVAYRDRSADEIRDISMVRFAGGVWSKPEPVHQDGWQIAGCPVNGPVADSYEDKVALAWFTAANNEPRVKVVFSTDRGKTFSAPLIVDDGTPAGRVDVTFLDESNVAVSWLARGNNPAVKLRLFNLSDLENPIASHSINVVGTASSRQSGFPQMESNKQALIFAWTEVQENKQTIVRTGMIKRDQLKAAVENP